MATKERKADYFCMKTEAELAAIFKMLDRGRRTWPITAEEEAGIQDEIRKYRAEQRRRKA